MEIQHKEHDKDRDAMKKSTRNKFDKMKSKWDASEKYVCIFPPPHFPCSFLMLWPSMQENEAEELTLKLASLKKEEKERGRKIKNLEAEIVKVKAQIDSPVKLEKVEVLIEETVRSVFDGLGVRLTVSKNVF